MNSFEPKKLNSFKTTFLSQKKKVLAFLTLLLHICLSYCTNQNQNPDQDFNQNQRRYIDITIIDEIINSVKIRSKTQLTKLLNETDSTYMMYYYSKQSNNSIIGAAQLQMIDRKLDYLAKILFIDCGEVEHDEFSACIGSSSEYDYFPRIRLLIPNAVKFNEAKEIIPHREIGFNKEYVSDKTMYEFITENIISFSVRLKFKNFKILEKQYFFNKVVLFTEKDSTPLIYRGLSNYFYDRIVFAEVGKNETELCEKFNVTKFPTILILENNFFAKENFIVHKYEGMMFIRDLKAFIDKYAYKEKHYMVRLSEMKAIRNKVSFLDKINYDEFFEENKNDKKIVYFHEDDNDYNDEFSIPEDIKGFIDITNGFFKFASFNCRRVKKVCVKNFLVEKLPALVFYNEDTENDYYLMMKKSYNLPLNKKELYKSFNIKYESKYKKLKETDIDELKKIIAETKSKKQHVLIFFEEDEANYEKLALKLISNIPFIEKKLAIYTIQNPSEDLAKYLKVTSYPNMVLLMHENEDKASIKKIPYNFKDFEDRLWFLDIKVFLENSLGLFEKEASKLNINPHYEYLQIPNPSVRVFKEASFELDFRKNCLHNPHGRCLILLLNGELLQESKTPNLKFKKNLALMNEIIRSPDYAPFSQFYFVNATCHLELANSFKIGKKNFPALIFYNSQYQLYTKFDRKFTKDNVYEFLDKMLGSKLPGNKIEPKDVKFEFKNCKKVLKYAESIDFDRLERIKLGLEDEDENIEELNLPDETAKEGKIKDEI